MGSIKLKIHPLFIILGAVYAFTGKFTLFIICTVSALLHEAGHSLVAGKMGYSLNNITLMPFGAVVSGNIDGLKCADELKIAVAGPLVNISIGIFCLALWWAFPITYAFTDVIAEANFSMAIVNCIPVFPLDGGRVASSLLGMYFGKNKSYRICKASGIIFATLIFALFIASAFYSLNVSLLFFSLFVLVSALDKKRENVYVKMTGRTISEKLKKGMSVKRIAVDKSVSLKKLISLLDLDCVNEVAVYDDGKRLTVIYQEEINDIIVKSEIYSSIGEIISKLHDRKSTYWV